MTIQSKHLVLLALIALPACVSSSGTQSPIHALEMAGSSRETAVAAISTSDYYAYQVTATVEAHNVQLTERAESMDYTATARVWDATSTAASSQSTSTAAAVATSNASQATETQHVFNITSTADYAAVQAYATQKYAEAKQAELSVERLELTNKIRASVPWAMLITLFIAAIALGRNWSRFRLIHRDYLPVDERRIPVVPCAVVNHGDDRSKKSRASYLIVIQSGNPLNNIPQYRFTERMLRWAEKETKQFGDATGHDV